MRIDIQIELDESQHTSEQIDEIAREAKFASEGAVGQVKMNQRPRRDFDYEITAEYTTGLGQLKPGQPGFEWPACEQCGSTSLRCGCD